jgi:alkyl hydroperoxide reductase subunit AhpC
MLRLLLAGIGSIVLASPLYAALKQGVHAPAFTTAATLGGKPFTFSLAEATDRFKALGVTVVGVSHDSIDTLNRFSVSECRNKFAVASDPDKKISTAYDANLFITAWANRTSYVIAPDGTIIYAYTALNPDKHVENTMAAVEKWQARQKKGV